MNLSPVTYGTVFYQLSFLNICNDLISDKRIGDIPRERSGDEGNVERNVESDEMNDSMYVDV